MHRAAAEVWKYGDPENHDLREALAAHHGVQPSRIAIGEGIDGLLQLVARLFIREGAPIITSAGAYPTFLFHVHGFGGRPVLVPYLEDHEDPDALVAAAWEHRSSLVYLANPDNPMGTVHPASRILGMLQDLPQETVLALDEAYVEFGNPSQVLDEQFFDHRLVRLRTFSKAYGMAGARIGYAIAPSEIALAFDRVRNHFGVNRIAQAGALAAINDQEHLSSTLAQVAAAKDEIARIAQLNHLEPLPSATNFVAIDTGRDGHFSSNLVRALAERGVFVRMPTMPPQDRCIRVSAGPAKTLAALKEALPEALAEIAQQ